MEENKEFRFSIMRHIGVLAEGTKGWKKEVNIVSWNDRPAKLDIREWDENHVKMSKGITLSAEESGLLRTLIDDVDGLFAEAHS